MAASAQDFADFLNLFGAGQHAMNSGDRDGVAACFAERYCIPDAPHTAWWPPTEWE